MHGNWSDLELPTPDVHFHDTYLDWINHATCMTCTKNVGTASHQTLQGGQLKSATESVDAGHDVRSATVKRVKLGSGAS